MDITRIKDAETGEIHGVDIPGWDVELEMEVHARNRGALLAAIARYIVDSKTMPSWLGQAVCSEWGRSVIASVIKEAEASVNPNKRD